VKKKMGRKKSKYFMSWKLPATAKTLVWLKPKKNEYEFDWYDRRVKATIKKYKPNVSKGKKAVKNINKILYG
jgi:hypothetical protein